MSVVRGQALVLVAGFPGTGKSRFCECLRKRIPALRSVSVDEVKEVVFDRVGFDGPRQKRQVERAALGEYFDLMEQAMRSGAPLLSEHPFSEKQRPRLAALAERFGYRVLTIRFVADLRTLFARQRQRDLDSTRHPGHLLTSYRRGDQIEDRSTAEGILTWEEFRQRCETRGYGIFRLGDLIEVDTTDFATVDYDGLSERVRSWLTG